MVLGLILPAVLFLRFVFDRTTENQLPESVALPPKKTEEKKDTDDTNKVGNQVRVSDDPSSIKAVVVYTNNHFFPALIEVGNSTDEIADCVVTIINQSSEELKIRLGPYVSGMEKGFAYAPISPGSRLFLDPRYRGIQEAVFYNLDKPEVTFKVGLRSNCLLE